MLLFAPTGFFLLLCSFGSRLAALCPRTRDAGNARVVLRFLMDPRWVRVWASTFASVSWERALIFSLYRRIRLPHLRRSTQRRLFVRERFGFDRAGSARKKDYGSRANCRRFILKRDPCHGRLAYTPMRLTGRDPITHHRGAGLPPSTAHNFVAASVTRPSQQDVPAFTNKFSLARSGGAHQEFPSARS